MSPCLNGCSRDRHARGLCRACYNRRLRKDKAYGRFQPRSIPAGHVVAHLDQLGTAGLGRQRVAIGIAGGVAFMAAFYDLPTTFALRGAR